jgi:inorganic triphosphatase YgiF
LVRALEARADHRDGTSRRLLVSTYFDTSDHALARQGLQLRVREEDGHFVQTVKSDARDGVDGLTRGEWEDAIAGARPDPQAAESGRFLASEIVGRLLPLFRTEIARRTIALTPAPDTVIEAAIDRGRVYALARDASEPVSEVELELKSGAPAALYDVALELLAVAPLRLEQHSKAARGYRLMAHAPAPASAAHAAAVELDPEMSSEAALQRIGAACLAQILHNEAAVLAGVAEGIHQMRVAVRRLRAILSGFGKILPAEQWRHASDELRWLADTLGPARNLDVFTNALLAPAQKAVAAPGLTALAAAAERRRQTAYAKAARAVRSRRYTALLLHQLRWFESREWRAGAASADLDEPIGALAGRILTRRRRAAKRQSKGFARQSAQDRHKLRIALKKLRYATEALGSLYAEKAVVRFTKRLKRLQDDLGDANDLRVARGIVASLARYNDDSAMIAEAGAGVVDWHERRLAGRDRRLRKDLDRLIAAKPFWKR